MTLDGANSSTLKDVRITDVAAVVATKVVVKDCSRDVVGQP